jgi:6-phosphogluconate dehydrogenase
MAEPRTCRSFVIAKWSRRCSAPVVEDQRLDASQALEEPSVTAVAASRRECIEELRQALIEDRAVNFAQQALPSRIRLSHRAATDWTAMPPVL